MSSLLSHQSRTAAIFLILAVLFALVFMGCETAPGEGIERSPTPIFTPTPQVLPSPTIGNPTAPPTETPVRNTSDVSSSPTLSVEDASATRRAVDYWTARTATVTAAEIVLNRVAQARELEAALQATQEIESALATQIAFVPTVTPTPTPDFSFLTPTPTPTPGPHFSDYNASLLKLGADHSESLWKTSEYLFVDRIVEEWESDWFEVLTTLSPHMLSEDSLSADFAEGPLNSNQSAIIDLLRSYHPDLRTALLLESPDTAQDSDPVADGILVESELNALDQLHAVFAMEKFYRAFSLETLRVNEIQALIALAAVYDPYEVVHSLIADPYDESVEGGTLNRILDDYGVFAGSCLYCDGDVYRQSRPPRSTLDRDPAHVDVEQHEYIAAATKEGVFTRLKLLNLVHHIHVDYHRLSPCSLDSFNEAELYALGINTPGKAVSDRTLGAPLWMMYDLVAGTRVTEANIRNGIWASSRVGEEVTASRQNTSILALAPNHIKVGEILNPFTHGAAIYETAFPDGLQPGVSACEVLTQELLDWFGDRYYHFIGSGGYAGYELYKNQFPSNPIYPPSWAVTLGFEAGNKSSHIITMMRAMNIPTVFWEMTSTSGWSNEKHAHHPAEQGALSFWKTSVYGHENLSYGDIVWPAFNAKMNHNDGFNSIAELQPIHEDCSFERDTDVEYHWGGGRITRTVSLKDLEGNFVPETQQWFPDHRSSLKIVCR